MIGELKAEFEQYLRENAFKSEPESLYEPINYIMATGGKRFRPLLCLVLSRQKQGELSKEALLGAYILELFHNFTLVHDDIMDEADIRRGAATVHKKYSTPKAILSGDAMLILCFQLINRLESEQKELIREAFIQTALEVCHGQELDMEFEKSNQVEHTDYIEMVRLKTGVLLGLSMFMGSLLGGMSVSEARQLQEAGEQVGIAFQIKDDYLDVYGDSVDTGKKQGGDILNGKKTLLYHYSMMRATEEDKRSLKRVFDSSQIRGEREIALIKGIYDHYDIPAQIKGEIELYNKQSRAIINAVPLKQSVVDQLSVLFPMLTVRNK